MHFDFVDDEKWLPLLMTVPPGPGPIPNSQSQSQTQTQTQVPSVSVVYGQRRIPERKNKTKTKLGAAGLSIALAVVYCVGKFGGMFKQRNELVDKHHYGYLASTLNATTRICLPTSCTAAIAIAIVIGGGSKAGQTLSVFADNLCGDCGRLV
ncbi:hypothetical protein ACLKA7_015219 [Drosophila subpalustris]